MNIKKKLKENSMYIAAFLVPWLLILIHSVLRNGWPMGESNILRGDSGLQYYQICVELWNKVHNGGSLFYSWNAGGGFDFYLNFAYYLLSPFTVLIVLVPKTWLADTVQAVMILKWSGVYISYVYFFMHTKYNTLKSHRRIISFILGSMVALSNTMIINITFFNWNDVIMLFPLILLQVENILDGKFSKKYYVLLTLTMLCNFYMAYQVCVFLAIWFFVSLAMMRDPKKICLQKIKYFMIYSLLAALTSMAVILPSVSRGMGKITFFSQDRKEEYIKNILVDVFSFLRKFYIFDDISDSLSYDPNMYFSIGALILLMLYAGVKSRYKVKNMIITVFFICGVFFGALSFVLHGFSVPHGIYHRYIYMFFFMSAIIILDIIQNIDKIAMKKVVGAIIVADVLLVLSYVKMQTSLSDYVYIFTLVLTIFYESIIFLFFRKKLSVEKMMTIFGIMVISELFINSEYELKNYDVEPIDQSNNTQYVGELKNLCNLENGERIDVVNGLRNDGLLYDYSSNDIFLSYSNENLVGLYAGVGMDYYDEAGYGLIGASPILNVMFNVRYGIGDNSMLFSDVKKENESGDLSLFRTEHLAGLGYMVSESISDWNTNRIDPFAIQNDFIELSTDVKDVFNIEKPEVRCSNADGVIDSVQQYEEAGFYLYEYKNNDFENQEYTLIEFSVPRDMDLYVVTSNGKKAFLNAYIDDQNVYCDSVAHSQQTLHIGEVKYGQTVKIYAIHQMNPGEENVMWYQFGSFNERNFQSAYEQLSESVYHIQQMNDTYIKGNINVKERGIMMTSIQAVDGFAVYVDGEKTDYKVIGNTFIGVPLEKGDHTVEFRYITPYLKEGIIGSLIGLLLFLFSFPMTKFTKKDT